MSTRLSSIDDQYQLTFPANGQWLDALRDSTDLLLQYVADASSSLPLPLAQVTLQRPVAEPGWVQRSEYRGHCELGHTPDAESECLKFLAMQYSPNKAL